MMQNKVVEKEKTRFSHRYKKIDCHHDNQSLLTLNLIPWKTLQIYGFTPFSASIASFFLRIFLHFNIKEIFWQLQKANKNQKRNTTSLFKLTERETEISILLGKGDE